MGVLHNRQGEYLQGLEYLEQALALRQTVGWQSAERITLLAMAVSYDKMADWVEYERILTRVVELSRILNHPELERDLSELEQVRVWRRQTGL
jgi:hypothetical protein